MSILNYYNIGDTIAYWKINKIITNQNNSLVLEVALESISPEELINVFNYRTIWTMKIRNDVDEGEIYSYYKLSECPFALDSPKEKEYFSGNIKIINNKGYYETHIWYVTEKYDEDISKNYIFAKQNWKHLLISVIEFLRFVHVKKIIHGDIKAKNILYKSNSDILFKVCDYESLASPYDTQICMRAGYDGFYYYGIGCMRNEPIFSYRMDLEAFGYILWAVLLSTEKLEYTFDWQDYAFDLYKKKIRNDNNNIYETKYTYLDNLKKIAHTTLMLKIIDKYFKIISTIKWNSEDPPDNKIYDQLIELTDFTEI